MCELLKKGYDVFGKEYGVMLRNDLHSPQSVDHKFLQEMVLLNEDSRDFCYRTHPPKIQMETHELYPFSLQFKGSCEKETIQNVLMYTSAAANIFDVDFEKMKFGGTEKEILNRGTDWCSDMARVGAVLLYCLKIPARIVHLANLQKAYNGHVVTEAFYEGKYGVCDFLYGYCFYDGEPLDTYTLMHHREYLSAYPGEYADLYSAAAINEYNPMDSNNNYEISVPNEYYLKLINCDHQGKWIMGEGF